MHLFLIRFAIFHFVERMHLEQQRIWFDSSTGWVGAAATCILAVSTTVAVVKSLLSLFKHIP